MGHPKDDEVYPIGTVVRIIKTGEFALIKKQTFLMDGWLFLHYLGNIEGREEGALYCLIHSDLDLECLP